ncbi:MAG: hypothetical protein M1832_000857 [Thelocarpon impressellum]|nr:MAG: hypothetical protein M1832_000857 [Thelocarpon impressellum]
MLLEDEDWKLLEKIAEVIGSSEAKTSFEYQGLGLVLLGLQAEGYGSKILRVTAAILDRGGVWGDVTNDAILNLATKEKSC